MAELINNDIQDAIKNIEKCLDGKNLVEMKVLKNSIKTFQLEHKIQIQAKDIQIKDREIQIQFKENQILKLENEIKLLKMKTNDVEEETTPLRNEKQTDQIAQINLLNDFKYIETDGLPKGINKFFFGEKTGLFNSFQEWFDVMRIRLTENTPYIYEKFVLVKVTCRDPKNVYYFYSNDGNTFDATYTQLNIFDNGWRHESTSVLILHPNHVYKSLKMREDLKSEGCHCWKVDYVPKGCIDEDGYFIIVCLKK